MMADWHANAKLGLHTDSTVLALKELAQSLGYQMRTFANKICSEYDTHELPREEAAWARRRAKKASQSNGDPTAPTSTAKVGPLQKVFNLVTYKLHALGDYITHILRFGSTDSYLTQTVSVYCTQILMLYK